MSFNIGGNPVPGVVVGNIQNGKQIAEQVVQSMISEVVNDPGKNIREMQQPSGLSTFLDIKI